MVDKRTIHVDGLVDEATVKILNDAFIPFGEIVCMSIQIAVDYKTQEHRGFAFVEYEAAEDAAAAIAKMNGAELMGKAISCSIAKSQEKNYFKPTKRKNRGEDESLVPHIQQSMKSESPSPANVPLEFLSMNDDCIEKLVTYMPLRDLCATSKVCKRLQTLSENEFACKYGKSAWIVFDVRSWDDDRREEYEICFGKLIKNISIRSNRSAIDSSILDSLSSSYNQMQFYYTDFVNTKFDERMQKLVEKAETIDLRWCEVGDLFDNLLKYCRNLKSLVINVYGMQIDTNWMLQTYPLLQRLQLEVCGESTIEMLPMLLQRNPTVKSLYLQDKDMEVLKQALKRIIEQTTSIEELFLYIVGDDEADLTCIYDELKQLCGQEHFKRLELAFGSITESIAISLQSFPSLNKLTDIHFEICELGFESIESLAVVNNVKTLEMDVDSCHGLNIDWNRWLNLQELYLDFLEKRNFGKLIVPFVRDLPQLRKVFAKRYTTTGVMHDKDKRIPFFSDYRSKLKDAVKLNIYVDEKTFEQLVEPFRLLNAANGLVKVKAIKYFWFGTDVKNPWIPFTYIEI